MKKKIEEFQKKLRADLVFPCVPTMITAIFNHPEAGGRKLGSRLRYFHAGGAPMPTELIAQIKDRGIRFGEGWGMSETSSVGISNPILANRIGSMKSFTSIRKSRRP